MTEDEFKKTMGKTIMFIVIALIILVIIGILVFNKSGKTFSIFSNEKEKASYKKSVQEINFSNTTIEEKSEKSDNQGEENIVQTETEPEMTENVVSDETLPENPVENTNISENIDSTEQ